MGSNDDFQFAQELLSTFGDSLGEVALIPATGGVFTVELVHAPSSFVDHELDITQLWDRKVQGGFPGETSRAREMMILH